MPGAVSSWRHELLALCCPHVQAALPCPASACWTDQGPGAGCAVCEQLLRRQRTAHLVWPAQLCIAASCSTWVPPAPASMLEPACGIYQAPAVSHGCRSLSAQQEHAKRQADQSECKHQRRMYCRLTGLKEQEACILHAPCKCRARCAHLPERSPARAEERGSSASPGAAMRVLVLAAQRLYTPVALPLPALQHSRQPMLSKRSKLLLQAWQCCMPVRL